MESSNATALMTMPERRHRLLDRPFLSNSIARRRRTLQGVQRLNECLFRDPVVGRSLALLHGRVAHPGRSRGVADIGYQSEAGLQPRARREFGLPALPITK